MSARCLPKAAGLLSLAATLILFSMSPATAQACSRAALPAAASQIVPTTRADQAVFSKAILVEVNYYRCKAGVKPLRLAGGLTKVAGTHANWMAAKRSLTHRSTVRGQSSVQERVLASGLPVRRGSENIGFLPRYQFNTSKKIYVRNKSRCEFTTTSGKRITPHTYASLARSIVGMWMKSPAHRKNVLDRNVNSVGAALGFDERGTQCGQFFMAQNFAG